MNTGGRRANACAAQRDSLLTAPRAPGGALASRGGAGEVVVRGGHGAPHAVVVGVEI